MELFTSILIGLGLAAACGFRVFVPLLVAGLAARFGGLPVVGGFGWIGSTPALVAFSVATGVEIIGYYVPWIDNLLDALATPTAIAAGILLMASTLVDCGPFLRWTLAVVAGGGTAALFQGLTTVARQVSSISTGGLGNPVLATVEGGSSALLAVLAVTLPIVALAVIAVLVVLVIKLLPLRRAAARPT
ncbi:MAG TPA: DUF4126 domain-containing protein [Thermoanaerobaculia bacterium]|nr:DUF4126 domain-containing protein [Thermoanaerobaculia bacterium]